MLLLLQLLLMMMVVVVVVLLLLLLLLLLVVLLLLPLPAVVPPACAAFARSSLSAISCTRASPVPESSEGMPRSVRHVPIQSHLHFSPRIDHHLFNALTSQPCVGDQTWFGLRMTGKGCGQSVGSRLVSKPHSMRTKPGP